MKVKEFIEEIIDSLPDEYLFSDEERFICFYKVLTPTGGIVGYMALIIEGGEIKDRIAFVDYGAKKQFKITKGGILIEKKVRKIEPYKCVEMYYGAPILRQVGDPYCERCAEIIKNLEEVRV